jgi:hypothetical protein
MRAAHRVGSTSSGGESGLNLFINDVKKLQVVEHPLRKSWNAFTLLGSTSSP